MIGWLLMYDLYIIARHDNAKNCNFYFDSEVMKLTILSKNDNTEYPKRNPTVPPNS